MTRAAIINALIRFARAIGRWILSTIIRQGAEFLMRYIGERIVVFSQRLARAKTARRRRWLLGRISRWQRAKRWLACNHPKIAGETAREADALAGKIPMVAAAERGR